MQLAQTAERCREELAVFAKSGRNNPQPCVDLWRWALYERSDAAWGHVIECWRPFLQRKLKQSSLARKIVQARSRSATRDEAEQSLIDDGFAEMAKGNLRHPIVAEHLGALLSYLWLCTENLMKMELRALAPRLAAASHSAAAEDVLSTDPPVATAPSPPGGAEAAYPLYQVTHDPTASEQTGDADPTATLTAQRSALAEAGNVLRGCARDERDYTAGVLLIFEQYTPQEVSESPRHRRAFPDVRELYGIKARLLKCLREHLGPP
jgi:hypothetical protein